MKHIIWTTSKPQLYEMTPEKSSDSLRAVYNWNLAGQFRSHQPSLVEHDILILLQGRYERRIMRCRGLHQQTLWIYQMTRCWGLRRQTLQLQQIIPEEHQVSDVSSDKYTIDLDEETETVISSQSPVPPRSSDQQGETDLNGVLPHQSRTTITTHWTGGTGIENGEIVHTVRLRVAGRWGEVFGGVIERQVLEIVCISCLRWHEDVVCMGTAFPGSCILRHAAGCVVTAFPGRAAQTVVGIRPKI